MLAATFEAGDQVKAFDQVLHKASAISAKVYADQDEAYWYKYYKGVTETDAQGLKVDLGGSTVNNLADNLILFGLEPGTNDNFRSTYTVFANIATQQYPALFKDTPIPDVKDIEDKSFITGAQARMSSGGAEGETPQYAANESGPVVSKRSYSINFDTGKATFTSEGMRTMSELKDSLAITGLVHSGGRLHRQHRQRGSESGVVGCPCRRRERLAAEARSAEFPRQSFQDRGARFAESRCDQ